MSELRKQLQTEGAAHRAARYPGDLARDVVGPRWHLGRWLAPAVGIAAAVLLTIGFWPQPERPPVVTNLTRPTGLTDTAPLTTTQVAPTEDSLWSIPSMPALPPSADASVPTITPADLGAMPDIGAMPSFPAYSEVTTNDESN